MAEAVRPMSGRGGWAREEEGLDMTGNLEGFIYLVIYAVPHAAKTLPWRVQVRVVLVRSGDVMPRSAAKHDGSPPLRQCSLAYPHLGLESMYLNLSPPRAPFRRGFIPLLSSVPLSCLASIVSIGLSQLSHATWRSIAVSITPTNNRRLISLVKGNGRVYECHLVKKKKESLRVASPETGWKDSPR